MVAVLQVDELPQDIPGAEALLSGHSEHRAEIDAREAGFVSFRKKGEALVAANHYASHEVCVCSVGDGISLGMDYECMDTLRIGILEMDYEFIDRLCVGILGVEAWGIQYEFIDRLCVGILGVEAWGIQYEFIDRLCVGILAWKPGECSMSF